MIEEYDESEQNNSPVRYSAYGTKQCNSPDENPDKGYIKRKHISTSELIEAIYQFKKELRILGMDKMTLNKYEIQVHHILGKTISKLI